MKIFLFNFILLNVLEGIKQFNSSTWFKKNRLDTPFKYDNVKAFIKMLNCEKLVLYFSEKVPKIATLAMLFRFSVTKQSLGNVLASPNDKKYPRYPLVLKCKVTLARPLCLVIPDFLLEILVRCSVLASS